MRVEAVIFDMDGVITDSEPLHAQAMDLVLGRRGFHLNDGDHEAIIGSNIDYTWRYLTGRFGLDGAVETWKAEYEQVAAEVVLKNSKPVPGLYELLDGLEERGIQLGLATSSVDRWVQAVFTSLRVTGRFAAVATGDMVTEGKPAPDLYKLAARQLGQSPAACLAIEDTPRGIASAQAAGMPTVAVRTVSTAHMDVSRAEHVIDSLRDFDFGWLE